MSKTFYIQTMGCKANAFESEIICENLIANGFLRAGKVEDADFFILNSCTVTHKSDNEAFYILRNVKHKNPNLKTVLTGCIAQVEKEKLVENDFIDIVIGNAEKLEIAKYLSGNSKVTASDIMHKTDFDMISLADTSKTRISLKIQDGCDNRCSYCIIPFARGKSRSAKVDFILKEVNNFAEKGFKEVVFTGIHIGQWGKDFGLELIDLLREIEAKTQIHRYRLGSLNPLEIDDELLNFLSQSKKFAPHFHLSLQSACNKTLKSMNRFYTVEMYLDQIEKINEIFDLPFLGSDIIAGFAGETDEDFEITRQNLEKSGLSKIHTFPYSRRYGTAGANMPNQVPDVIKNKRADIIKEISARKYDEFVLKNVGRVREVLTEKHPDKKTGFLKGMTDNYLPVILNSKDTAHTNRIVQAKIVSYEKGKINAIETNC